MVLKCHKTQTGFLNKCEATAKSVTGHVCVNSNIDKNYNSKQNTGKQRDYTICTEKYNENMYF